MKVARRKKSSSPQQKEDFSPASLDRARSLAVRRELERHLQVLRYALSGVEPAAWIWEAMEPGEQRKLRAFRAAGGEEDPELLTQVEQALKKMEDDTWGTCASCQKPILPERLQLLPWAERCTRCQQKADPQPSSVVAHSVVPVMTFFTRS